MSPPEALAQGAASIRGPAAAACSYYCCLEADSRQRGADSHFRARWVLACGLAAARAVPAACVRCLVAAPLLAHREEDHHHQLLTMAGDLPRARLHIAPFFMRQAADVSQYLLRTRDPQSLQTPQRPPPA